MLIYWIMLISIVFFGVLAKNTMRVTTIGNVTQPRVSVIFAILIPATMVFFTFMRTGFSDTYLYVKTFLETEPTFQSIINSFSASKGPLFNLITAITRCFTSNENAYLFILNVPACIILGRIFYKYSPDYMYSFLLFMITTQFLWLYNGMRQFIAAVVVFAGLKFIEEKKAVKFFILVAVAALIHNTALIMIPAYFIAQMEPWSKKMLSLIILSIIGIFLIGTYTDFFVDMVVEHTDSGAEYLKFNAITGVNPIRIAVAAVPCILSFISYKYIKEDTPKYIKVCINLSLLAPMFYLIAYFSSGTFIGRIPIYFELFDLILLPWLFKHIFHGRYKTILYISCSIFYLIFACVQLYIHTGFYYHSIPLGLYIT